MPESEMMDSIDDRINADEEILQIIYFLSRKGRIEHPHLIRVHHSDLGGVRLKDVKRWLSDVRGKEMPNNFSWSYKRRYKTGYIWQDLQDNDVINPITDKEYVLKGSEKSATSSPDRKPKRSNSFPAKKKIDSILEKTMSELSDHRTLRAGYEPMEDTRCNDDKKLEHLSIAAITSTNDILNPFGIYGLADSFSDSSQTDDGSTICSSREASNRENDVEKKFVIEQEIKEEVDGAPKMEDTEEDEDERLIRKNKKGSRLKRKGGCSSMNSRAYSRFLKDLLSCRAVDTKESAVKPLQCQPSMQKPSVKSSTSLEISSVKNGEGKNMNGSACWKSQKHVEKKKTYDGNPSPASVCTFLPQPTCSQCGKRFNPERLDAHMRSCKGLKLKDKRSAKQHLPQGDTEAANLTREETGAW